MLTHYNDLKFLILSLEGSKNNQKNLFAVLTTFYYTPKINEIKRIYQFFLCVSVPSRFIYPGGCKKEDEKNNEGKQFV